MNAALHVVHERLALQTISQPWRTACAEHTPQNAYWQMPDYSQS